MITYIIKKYLQKDIVTQNAEGRVTTLFKILQERKKPNKMKTYLILKMIYSNLY